MAVLGKNPLSRGLSMAFFLSAASLPAAYAQGNDLGLEAIIAPHVSMSFGESRTRFGVDFFRVSSGISLLAQYGTGSGYQDYSLIFRLSGLKQFFNEPLSRGLVYGVGAGMNYSAGVAEQLTQTPKPARFSDVLINPYARYLFDINGWIGPYLELGYEFVPYRHAWDSDLEPLKPVSGRFVLGFGVAFEAER
jgi:hypothetical protein